MDEAKLKPNRQFSSPAPMESDSSPLAVSVSEKSAGPQGWRGCPSYWAAPKQSQESSGWLACRPHLFGGRRLGTVELG